MTRIVQGSPARAARPSQRGVSLVEAIVAMAVMAFGMMALVGLQTTLRLNADVAKQRSEAVRIGEAAIENWRAFSTIPTTGGVKAYGDIALGVLADEAVDGSNATYTLKRTVGMGPGYKSMRIEVAWADRSGDAQSIVLSSIISGADPALSGVLSVLPGAAAVRHPLAPIPGDLPAAVDLGGGKSAYRPPGAPLDIVWVFNNSSSVITSVCTFAGEDLSLLVSTGNCIDQPSWLISGFVRFSFGANPSASNPSGEQIDLRMFAIAVGDAFANGDCYVTPVQDPKLTYTAYVCRVPQGADATWTGRILLGPPPAPADAPPEPQELQLDLAIHDVCRYSTGSGNINHPLIYIGLDRSLGSQNFLVIDKLSTGCPSATKTLQPPELLPSP